MEQVTLWLGGPELADGSRPLHFFEWKDGKPYIAKAGMRGKVPAKEIDSLPIGDIRERLQPNAAASLQSFGDYGRALYRILHYGHVGKLWKKKREAGPVRTYLCVDDLELGGLPWEMLHEHQLAFAERSKYPLIRCPTLELQKPGPIRWPLRVLVLVGAAPGAGIAAEDELARLKRLCRLNDFAFDLDVVDASCDRLAQSSDVRELFKGGYDVFHFIGHAATEKNEAGQRRSVLYIYDRGDSQGNSWPWSAAEIKATLESTDAHLRFAYLNTCRSADAKTPSDEPERVDTLSLTTAFQDHACAVIAMQAEVPGSKACACAIKFYEEIAKGRPLDQALQEGRLMLGPTAERGPYLPVLTGTAPIDMILPEWPDDDLEQRLSNCNRLKLVNSAFIDRHPHRRSMMAGLFREDTATRDRKSAAVLRGPSEIGKTWLGYWLLHACVRQQIQAHYVEPNYSADWLEVLRCICSGIADDPETKAMQPGLPMELVAQFYWEIEQLAKGGCPPFGPMPPEYEDRIRCGENTKGRLLRVCDVMKTGQAKDFDINAMTCFRNLLAKSAAAQPLLLIIDHLRKGDLSFGEHDLKALMRGIFDPISNDREGPIRILLILPSAETNPYPTVKFSERWLPVDLSEFPPDQMQDLIVEFLARLFPDRKPPIDLGTWTGIAYTPRQFCEVFTFLGQMLPQR
jgi:hypothetical protein